MARFDQPRRYGDMSGQQALIGIIQFVECMVRPRRIAGGVVYWIHPKYNPFVLPL